MLTEIWQQVVFRPLFNFLIYLYQYHTNYNLGLAVVYMTVLLRVVLLPFSIMTEQGKEFYRRIHTKVEEAQRDYTDDAVKQRTVIRDLLRKNKIRPWAKLVVLLFHVFVLVALYQVFVSGVRGGNILDSSSTGGRRIMESLYPAMPRPDFINTNFFCFDRQHCLDISRRSLPFSALVALVLFIEITISQRGHKGRLTSQEIVYRLLFPAFTFVALGLLPAVKSVFILTSLLLSIMISLGGTLFWGRVHRHQARAQKIAAAGANESDPFSNQLYGR